MPVAKVRPRQLTTLLEQTKGFECISEQEIAQKPEERTVNLPEIKKERQSTTTLLGPVCSLITLRVYSFVVVLFLQN